MPVKHSSKAAGAPDRDVDTEQKILDAANEVFMRRGTAGARMQDIAQEAGVNQALLHYYFRSKERLAEAVFRRAASRLLPGVVRILSAPGTLEEKVQGVVNHEFDELLRTPHLPAYILSEINQQPERAGQLISALTGLAVEGVARGVFGPLKAQIDERVAAGTMRRIPVEHFVINLLSLCIFPFAARPLLCAVLDWKQDDFVAFIEQRRKELPVFFFQGLRP